jgi:hypothetical protein
MSGNPVEGETRWERTPQPAQSFERFFPAAIAAHLELSRARDTHFDLISVLEV